MAALELSTFEKILTSFQTRLSKEDVELFRITTFDDLKSAVSTIQKEQAARKGLRNLNKIKPFLSGLNQYAQVLEVYVQVKPEMLGFIWGPIKLCLQIASRLKEAFDVLLDAYEKIGTSLPILSAIDALFCNNRHVKQILGDVFEDILDFHKRAIVFFKCRTWKLCFKTTYRPFTLVFEDILKKLDRSRELLLQSADIAHFQESQEARILFTKEFQVLVDGQQKQRQLEVMESLSTGPNFDILHQELQEIRAELPGTTRWIFSEPKMIKWFDRDECAFRISGIPGAGKTVMFSSIIDEIKSRSPDSQVIYFYCKNNSPFQSNFVDVARSLILQVLQMNPNCLDFIHECILKSGELRPKNPAFFLRILEEILMNHDSLYIGIDGLDECPEEDRKLLSDLIGIISKAQNSPGNVKMLITSRNEKDLKKSLHGISRLDVKPWNVESDITAYVTMKVSQLSQKFDFSKSREHSIAAEICSRPKGMFLLARLIMDNLLDQDSLEDLNEELRSEILPHGIGEAYERMLIRIGKADSKRGLLEKRVRRANCVLQLLTTASRALFIHEIQGALAINLEEQNVDFEGRHSRLPLDDLCGPIIQVHENDLVEMIHPTAKEYLQQHHSRYYIRSSMAMETMATICVSYLTFECFQPEITDDQKLEYVLRGDFAFQEYAVCNWVRHLDNFLQNKGIDSLTSSSLWRAFLVLNDQHEDLSISLSQSNIPSELDISQVIGELVELYDKSEAFLADEFDSQERMPYILLKLYQHRSAIEKQMICVTDLKECERLTKYYGKSPFRCPVAQCPYFVTGFVTHEKREKHRKSHQRPFKCTNETCDYFVIGLPSEAALRMHLSLHHENLVQQPVFPSIKAQSLEKDLENAIEANDLMAVTALATELASFPERKKGYVLQATKLKYREVALVLLDLLGTPSEIDYVKGDRTAILTACEIGDEVLLNKLLEKGSNINNFKSINGEDWKKDVHPISLAAKHGHITIVRILLNQKDLSLVGSTGGYRKKGAIALASMSGFSEIVTLLLESDLPKLPEARSDIDRSLKLAARSGKLSTARLILRWASDNGMTGKLPPSIRKIPDEDLDKAVQILSEKYQEIKEDGGTRENYLQAMSHKGDLTEVSRLLDLGADIENNSGEWGTPLMAAASNGKLEVMQLLIDRGAKIMTMDLGKDRTGGSAIDYAAANGEEKAVRTLLDKGAKLNFQSLHRVTSYGRQRFTVLQMLIQRKNSVPCIKLLLEHGAEVDELGGSRDASRKSLLQLAAQYGYQDSLQLLVEYGADINFTDPEDGNTPLHNAAYMNNLQNLKFLIKHGARINATNQKKMTALMSCGSDYYFRTNSQDCIEELVDNGADIDMADIDGNTALMLVAKCRSDQQMFKALIDKGANTRIRNSERRTVLMLAVESYHEAFVKYLLECKADLYVNEVEEIGDSLKIAARRGALGTFEHLLKFISKIDPTNSRFNAALSVALSTAKAMHRQDMVSLLLEYGDNKPT